MRRRAENSCRIFSEPSERLLPNSAGSQHPPPKESLIDSDLSQPAIKTAENKTVFPQKLALIRASRGLTSLHRGLGTANEQRLILCNISADTLPIASSIGGVKDEALEAQNTERNS